MFTSISSSDVSLACVINSYPGKNPISEQSEAAVGVVRVHERFASKPRSSKVVKSTLDGLSKVVLNEGSSSN